MQNGRVGFDSTLYHPSNFGIGFDDPSKNIIAPSALIEMKADDKGLLIPRMTADQMTAIAQPANSLLVYNTTDSTFNYYDEKSNSWIDLSKGKTGDLWNYNEDYNVFLHEKFNYVGIGTENPQTKLHLFTDKEHIEHGFEPPAIRLEAEFEERFFGWDIQNNNDKLKINFGKDKEPILSTETKFVFTEQNYFGIGTETPMANIHIKNYDQKAHGNKSNIILESYRRDPVYFEIANKNGMINFNYTTEGKNTSILNYNPNSQKLNLLNENCTIDNKGTVTETKFVGDGSDLTNLPFLAYENIWKKNGREIYYNSGYVGIGTGAPKALFSVNNEFLVQSNGYVYAREITVTPNNIPDYVFSHEYELISIDSLKNYVSTYSHLPEIPSANIIEQNGMDLGDFNRLLLLKTEELTLYIFELQEQISKLEEQVSEIQNKEK